MSSIIRPAKILLVDDQPGNLLALEAVLAAGEYEMIFAHSGGEALALLRQHRDIALILLDVQMPELDGFEVAKRVKAMPECRDIPIIFITAVHTDNPFVVKGYRAGAVDYFSKPFDPEILKTKVGIYVSFRQKAELVRENERHAKESEELLRASRKLSAIFDSSPVGVIIADVDGKIYRANDVGSRFLKSREETSDESHVKLSGGWGSLGSFPDGIEESLMVALGGGPDSHDRFALRDGVDVSSRSISTHISPLRDRDGKILGAVIIIQDITPHKEVGDELEKRIKHLVSSDA